MGNYGPMPPRWTKADDEFLRNNYDELGGDEVARILGRTGAAIRHRAHRLHIPAGIRQHTRAAMKLRTPTGTIEATSLGVWKRLVKERDDFTCQCCGLREPLIVNAHHRVAVAAGGSKFSVANGLTLCPNCHALEHATKGGHTLSRNKPDNTIYERIRSLLQQGYGLDAIADHLHVNSKTVQAVKDGRR